MVEKLGDSETQKEENLNYHNPIIVRLLLLHFLFKHFLCPYMHVCKCV